MEKPITRYILMFCVGLVFQNDQNSHCYVVFVDAELIGNSKQIFQRVTSSQTLRTSPQTHLCSHRKITQRRWPRAKTSPLSVLRRVTLPLTSAGTTLPQGTWWRPLGGSRGVSASQEPRLPTPVFTSVLPWIKLGVCQDLSHWSWKVSSLTMCPFYLKHFFLLIYF